MPGGEPFSVANRRISLMMCSRMAHSLAVAVVGERYPFRGEEKLTDQELIASIIKQIEDHRGVDVEVIDFKTAKPHIPRPASFNWRVKATKVLRDLIDELV